MNQRTADSIFIRACRGLPVEHAPVWYMRQAGRSLPEYRATRAGVAMLDACANPDLVTEITLQPVRRHGVDAAILFSDIVVPLRAVGVGVEIKSGVGPVIDSPIRTESDIARLGVLEPDAIGFISQAVKSLAAELGATPLIGFAGGPFTLACYLVEGGPSKNFDRTRAFMYAEPAAWRALMDRLTQITISFLQVQVAAGASAVQLFDSWAGQLNPEDYRHSVLPFSAQVFTAITDVPRIHFGVGTGEILSLLGDAGADVVGVDWRVPLDAAALRVPGKAVQGNLDPALLLAPWPVTERRARDILARGRSAHGHVFNLGHGVLPQTDPDQLARLTDLVHSVSTAG